MAEIRRVAAIVNRWHEDDDYTQEELMKDLEHEFFPSPIRDQLAIAALVSTPDWIKDRRDGYPEIARRCYVMADDMLEARKSKEEA